MKKMDLGYKKMFPELAEKICEKLLEQKDRWDSWDKGAMSACLGQVKFKLKQKLVWDRYLGETIAFYDFYIYDGNEKMTISMSSKDFVYYKYIEKLFSCLSCGRGRFLGQQSMENERLQQEMAARQVSDSSILARLSKEKPQDI